MRHSFWLLGTLITTGSSSGFTQTTTPVYSYTIPANGYSPNGNVTNLTDSVTGSWTMQYDHLNRLKGAIADSSSPGQYQGINLQWQYDSFGNRLSQTAAGATSVATVPAPSLTFGPDNRISTVSTGLPPTYDGSGNVTFDGASTYALYDADNRVCATYSTITNSGITQYLYNAEGRRVAKGHPISNPSNSLFCPADLSNFAISATYVLGPSGEQMTEVNGSGQWQHTNVYNAGQLLATYDPNGVHFALADSVGTLRVRASGAGAVEQTDASLPFGDSLITSSQDVSEQHFTGKERDTESGLDYFGARYYASSMGRFMSPDWSTKIEPVPYSKLDDPQTLNLYGYVGNNPLSRRDADGHEVDLTGNAKDKQAEQQRLAANASRTDKNGVKESSLFKQNTDKNGKTTLTLDKNAAASYDGKHSSGYNMLNSAIGAKGTISVQMTDLISDQTVSDGHGSAAVSLTRSEPTYDPNLPMKGVNGQVIPNPPQIIAGHEVLGHGLNSILGREHGEATAIGVENILRGEQGLPLRQPDPTKQ